MEEVKIYKDPMADIVVLRLWGEHENEIDQEIALVEEKLDDFFDNMSETGGKDKDWCLITIPVKDWSHDMTPWETSEMATGGGAKEMLDYILNKVISKFEVQYGNDNRKYILAGYSLAGLFSLWASYQTDRFIGIVAGSPSVWYPEWMEYIENNKSKASKVYLSIGSKEHKTRNALMSQVALNIQKQYELLGSQGVDVVFEVNSGNHFKEVTQRMAKGIANSIENM